VIPILVLSYGLAAILRIQGIAGGGALVAFQALPRSADMLATAARAIPDS